MSTTSYQQWALGNNGPRGEGGECFVCLVGEAYEALKKTPYIKPYKFSIFLVLLAVPFWIIGLALDREQPNQLADENAEGMALDREQPNQLADEILLVIGGALHELAYFIIEISGCRLLKSKWYDTTCCRSLFLWPIRCGACGIGTILGLSLATLESSKTRDRLLWVNVFALLGYFVTNLIFLEIFYKERIAGKEQPKENNQLELGEGITGEEQPKENNQQAPGEANRKVKPSDSLASRLQELKQAKDQGLISEAEFQQGKSDLVSGIIGASKTV
jgi:hypothetical protein